MNRAIINSITFSRLLLLPLLYFIPNPVFLFIGSAWCGLSDFLDGYLAKRLKSSSSFGVKLDQFADKIVALYFFIDLYLRGQVSIWFVVLYFLREGFILMGRRFELNVEASNIWGKIKTAFVYTLIAILYCNNYFSIITVEQNKFLSIIFQVAILSISFYSYYISIEAAIKSKLNQAISKTIGSSLYTAYIFKRMPGTSSSLFVFPLFYYFQDIMFEIKIVIIGVLIIAHYLCYYSFSKQIQKEDPGEYTLDETIAIAFCWFMPFHTVEIWILCFILFRFFDIIKPFGIKVFEKSNNFGKATRVLGDDLIAIFYTLIMIHAIERFVEI